MSKPSTKTVRDISPPLRRVFGQGRNQSLRHHRSSTLTGLQLQNFRGFPRDAEIIPLGKMTLIFGPNSGGKSTILRALASFPQSLSENRNRVDISDFSWLPTGQWFDLGSRHSVIHKGYKENEETKFSIGLVFNTRHKRATTFDIESVSNETTHESASLKVAFSLPEDFDWDRKSISLITPNHFDITGEHVPLQGKITMSESDARKLPIPKKLFSGEEITTKFTKTQDQVTLELSGPESKIKILQSLFQRPPRHRLCLASIGSSDVSEKLVYEFDFGDDIHRASLSKLHLEREEKGNFSEIFGLEFDGDSWEPIFSKDQQEEYEKFISDNLGLFDRNELKSLIIDMKHSHQEQKFSRDEYAPKESYEPSENDLFRRAGNFIGQKALKEWENRIDSSPPLILFQVLEILVGNQLLLDKDSQVNKQILFWSEKIEELANVIATNELKIEELRAGVLCENCDKPRDIEEEIVQEVVFGPNDEPGAICPHCSEVNWQPIKNRKEQAEIMVRLTKIRSEQERHISAMTNAYKEQTKAFGLAEKPFSNFKQDSQVVLNGIGFNELQSKSLLQYPPPKTYSIGSQNLNHLALSLWHRKEPPKLGRFQQSGFSVRNLRHRYIDAISDKSETSELHREAMEIITELSSLVSAFTNRLDYLGPTRLSPKRIYSFNSWDSSRVGESGTKSISSLASIMIGQTKTAKENNEKFNKYLSRVVNLEAKFSKIKVSGSIVDPNLVTVQVSRPDSDDPGLALPDVGFGVSQCLPLLGSTLTNNPLLCEEAESNLHPAAQARLMDCLLESMAENSHEIIDLSHSFPGMILETHSEHFLKSLRNHLRNGQGLTDDDVVILYVESDENTGETVATRVLTEDGEFLQPWPRNRWDDETRPII